MELTIKRADNGYIIETDEIIDELETVCKCQTVVQDDDMDDPKTFVKLCWALQDILGVQDSRYSNERILIATAPGDKCEKEDCLPYTEYDWRLQMFAETFAEEAAKVNIEDELYEKSMSPESESE